MSSGQYRSGNKIVKWKVKRPAVAKLAKQVKTLVKAAAKPNRKTTKYPYGMEKTVTEKYADVFSNGMISGNVVYERVYKINSTFDPDAAAGGHQPYGRDQMAQFFNKYRVNNVRWRIRTVNITSGAVPVIAATITNEGSPFANPNDVVEQAAVSKQCPLNEQVTLKGRTDLAKLNGLSKAQYQAAGNVTAQVGQDPSEVQLLTVDSFSDQSTTTMKTIVEIWYNVTYYDPIHQNGS